MKRSKRTYRRFALASITFSLSILWASSTDGGAPPALEVKAWLYDAHNTYNRTDDDTLPPAGSDSTGFYWENNIDASGGWTNPARLNSNNPIWDVYSDASTWYRLVFQFQADAVDLKYACQAENDGYWYVNNDDGYWVYTDTDGTKELLSREKVANQDIADTSGWGNTLDDYRIAQSFVAKGDVRSVQIFARRRYAATSPAILRIETDNGGEPSGTLVSSDAVDTLSYMSIFNRWRTFEFDSPIPLKAESTYHIVFRDSSTMDNIPVCTEANDQYQAKPATDGYHGAIWAWRDSRNGSSDIYAQRIDSLGNEVWTSSGVAVCQLSGTQAYPAIDTDGDHGAIIAWRDGRGADYNIYAQRMGSLGNPIWTTDGIPICIAANLQDEPQVVSDGYHGAIVVWQDQRADGATYDLYAQRVDSLGNLKWPPYSPIWWNDSWIYRKQITVTAGSSNVPSGYSVSATFDHAALVSAGKALANGNDIRVLHWNGSSWTELDRALDQLSTWNDDSTQIWFALTDPIAASGSDDSYYLQYGNSSAGAPPDDWASVFMVGDDFDDGTLTSELNTSTSGTANISETGGDAFIDLGTDSTADAGIIAMTDSLPSDYQFAIRHKTKLVSGGGLSNPEVKEIGIVQWPSQPGVEPSATENGRRRIIDFHRVDQNAMIFYFDTLGNYYSWNGSSWVSSWSFWTTTLALDTYYIHELVSNGSSWYIKVSDANGTALTTTSSINWSEVRDTGSDPFWFYWGEVYTDFYYADVKSDWVCVRKYVSPEPTSSLGGEESKLVGVPICQAANDQWEPYLISDGRHGAIIVWNDDRVSASEPDIYCQRVDSLGKTHWATSDDTVTYEFDGYDPGQAWAWNPSYMVDGDTTTRATTNWNIAADDTQLCNSNTCPGTNLGAIATVEIRARIDVYGSDGYLYITPVFSGGDGTTRLFQSIYTNWTSWFDVTSDPNAPDPWTWPEVQNMDMRLRGVDPASHNTSCFHIEIRVTYSQGMAVCTASGDQHDVVLVSDGHKGALIAWHDYRGPSGEVYIQRMDSLGNAVWTADGEQVTDISGSQSDTWIASDGYNGAILAWEDERGTNMDVYAQRVDSLANMMWTANGVAVCTAGGDQRYPKMVSDDYHGAIITWDDYRSNMHYDIYAQRVDSLGNALWTNNGVAVAAAPDTQYRAEILSDGNHGAWITWYRDYRNADLDIYCDAVDSLGNVRFCGGGDYEWAYEAADYADGEMLERASGTDSWTHHADKDLFFRFPAWLLTDYEPGWWSDPKDINHTCAPDVTYDITKIDTDNRLECVDATRDWMRDAYDSKSTLYANTDSTLMWEVNFQVDQDWRFADTVNLHLYVYKAGGGHTTDILFKLRTTSGKLKWCYPSIDNSPLSQEILSSPVIRGGRVYVTARNSRLYSLGASDGSLKWQYTADAPMRASPSAAYESSNWTIYFADQSGWVYAVKDTGTSYEQKWKVQLTPGLVIRGSPMVMDSLVYVGTLDDSVHCLRTSDGSQKWARYLSGDIYSSTTVYNNVVYIGSYSDTLYAMNATDGTILRKYGTCGDITAPVFMTWTDGRICIGSNVSATPGLDTMYVIESSNFDTYWKFADSGNLASTSTSCFSLDDQNVYFGSDNNYLYCIDISDSSLVYKYQTGDDVKSSPLHWNGVVYFGSNDDKFYALDNSTEQPITGWPFYSNGNIESSPAISLDDDIVVVGSSDGRIYAFYLE